MRPRAPASTRSTKSSGGLQGTSVPPRSVSLERPSQKQRGKSAACSISATEAADPGSAA